MDIDPGHSDAHTAKAGKVNWRIFAAAGFVALIVALLAGWAYAWHRIAATVESEFDRSIATAYRQGQEINCGKRRIAGFPFRVGLFCDDLRIAVPGKNFSASAGAVRSAAQFYNPGHLVAEIDGPAEIEIAGHAPYALDWDGLRLSLNGRLDGSGRVSAEARKVSIADAWSPSPAPLATAGDIEAHIRRRIDAIEGDAIDLAFSIDDVAIATLRQGRPLAFSTSVDLELTGIADEARSGFSIGDYLRNNGLKGEIRSFALTPANGGSIAVSGPFEIGRDGMISLSARVRVTDMRQLAAFVAEILPHERERIASFGEAIRDTSGGAGDKSLNFSLDIERGQARIGLIPLGEIPPLF